MESLFILIVVGSLLYLGLELIFNDEDERLISRLLEYSPAKFEQQKDKKIEDEENSLAFLRNITNNFAQKVIAKSKNILAEKQMLTESGLSPDDETYLKFVSAKLTYAVIATVIAIFLAVTMKAAIHMKLMILIIGPLLGFKLPDINLKRKIKQRADSVTYTLPDAIDLLTICIEAGLGLDSAITRVAIEQEEAAPVLSQEFKRVGKDILAGIPRADAFRNLSKRIASPELRSFIGLLIQSDKLGTSIGQSLKVYSDSMRVKRRQKAEEQAAKASIKMTIPLVLFILPATFIVILTPAAISMIKVFSKGL